MTNHPRKGRGQVTWIILILVVTDHISGIAEARVIKFCTQIGDIKSQHNDDKSHLKGGGHGHVAHFYMQTNQKCVSMYK